MAFWKSEGNGEFMIWKSKGVGSPYDWNSQGMFFIPDLGFPECESTYDLTTLLTNMKSRKRDKHWLIIQVFAFIY